MKMDDAERLTSLLSFGPPDQSDTYAGTRLIRIRRTRCPLLGVLQAGALLVLMGWMHVNDYG
jgi:hypothetical protein